MLFHSSTRETCVAKGLCIRDDGTIIVDYGLRKIAIPRAQYRANGYKPPLEKLPQNNLTAVLETCRRPVSRRAN
jgi:hypothetical protein